MIGPPLIKYWFQTSEKSPSLWHITSTRQLCRSRNEGFVEKYVFAR